MEGMAFAPPADLTTSTALVTVLLADQAPALADLPVAWLNSGWDHDVYRLGEGLLVRLPRREEAVEPHANEAQWLPLIAASLTVRTPQPVFAGAPSTQFHRPWSVVEYIPGTVASDIALEERATFAEDVADFLWSLQAPAPTHAPLNPFRGGSLGTEAANTRARSALTHLARGGQEELAQSLLPRWEAWSNAPDFDGVDVWLHGDLHPHNLIISADGRLAGVIDWGDVTAGDPACDLATAWLTFDEIGRRAFAERVDLGRPMDAATWSRAKAWALHLGLVLATMTDDNPWLTATGLHALRALASEDA